MYYVFILTCKIVYKYASTCILSLAWYNEYTNKFYMYFVTVWYNECDAFFKSKDTLLHSKN